MAALGYRFLVVVVCMATAALLACPVSSQQDDISVIENISSFCVPDDIRVNNINAFGARPPATAIVTWDTLSPSPSPPASGYQVVYRLRSSTIVQFKDVGLDESQTTLTGLQDFSVYEVYVRVVCSDGVGKLSDGAMLTLVDAIPDNVTGIMINATGSVVMVSWDPLPEDQWNGLPLGYYISVRVSGSSDLLNFRVGYPQTSFTIGLRDGTYMLNVLAVNNFSVSVDFPSNQIELQIGSSSTNPDPDDVQVLVFLWGIILVSGLVGVVIIIMIPLVICRKIHEKKKRSVFYCRDKGAGKKCAGDTNDGFNNIIPMNNLNSPVTSTSLSIPNSSPTANCSAYQPNPLANRPLPNIPMSEVSPTFIEQDVPRFGNGLASNHQPERKMPHPGGLPLLHEAAKPGLVQMHRTNTSQSVFMSSGASAPPNPGHAQRTMHSRAQTVGGIPSPYELPEQNGNTLPCGAGEHHRPSTAHHQQHGHGGAGIFQVGVGGSIPPPPAHSPLPLTHSSMEIRARMADDVFTPGQHTLPRSMGSSRSYSVTSPHSNSSSRIVGSGGGGGSDGIRHMKSDGHLPILETHEEKVVYIQAPLDSSIEASIHSASSYRGGGGGGAVGGEANERRPSPQHHHPHHQHHSNNYHHTHHGHAPGAQPQQPNMMRQQNTSATYAPGSESFSEMMSEAGSMQLGPIPRMPAHHPPSFNQERSIQSAGTSGAGGRESVFSETSTELSISSTSEKEMSPSWDHRGTTSEVGVGFWLMDDLPADREAFSDVGTPGQLPAANPHRVYKQGVNPRVYDGNKIQYVHQSTYFHSAEKTAHVPFLDHQILEVDCAGREYTNVDHDITLRIPEGAVAEGEKFHFEVGVTMYGPFTFQENTQPISPILWLCILEEDIELKKPFQVVLPHYLIGLSKERIQHHHVRFSKANHCNYTFVDNQMTYRFEPYSDAKPHLATSGYRNYGVLISKHCCFFCLEAKATPELAMDAGYCLVQIESSLSLQRNEVFFAGTYFLDTCLRSLEEQFTHEGGYNIARNTSFKFQEGKAPSISAVVPKQDSQYTIGFQPSNANIKASDIAFWDKTFSIMKRMHKWRMYPPRVKMTVSIKDSSLTHFVLPVKFVGCRDNELDTDLTLPLGSEDVLSLSLTSIPSSRSASVGSQNSEPLSKCIICGKPKLKDIFKELYTVAASWKSIGTLLGIPGHILDKIKSNEERVDERLREMLSEWLKQIDPPPTWTALAEAVEVIDESKAQRLRQCSLKHDDHV